MIWIYGGGSVAPPGAEVPQETQATKDPAHTAERPTGRILVSDQVLEITDDASNPRYMLAECLEEMNDVRGAVEQYEQFVTMEPDDSRTKKAKKRLKRLKRKLK